MIYDLERFVSAQSEAYQNALAELKTGRKEKHWMWYFFPQLSGLGSSATVKFNAITNLEEAKRYLKHPILGKQLRECCEALLVLQQTNFADILDYPDNLKSCSSKTYSSTTLRTSWSLPVICRNSMAAGVTW